MVRWNETGRNSQDGMKKAAHLHGVQSDEKEPNSELEAPRDRAHLQVHGEYSDGQDAEEPEPSVEPHEVVVEEPRQGRGGKDVEADLENPEEAEDQGDDAAEELEDGNEGVVVVVVLVAELELGYVVLKEVDCGLVLVDGGAVGFVAGPPFEPAGGRGGRREGGRREGGRREREKREEREKGEREGRERRERERIL